MSGAGNVVLYTREDCHLCDIAAELLRNCAVEFDYADIESDLGLIRKYGQCIPVLFRSDSGQELFWPFDENDVRGFIGA